MRGRAAGAQQQLRQRPGRPRPAGPQLERAPGDGLRAGAQPAAFERERDLDRGARRAQALDQPLVSSVATGTGAKVAAAST
ncbi:MAG: hypothetical protein AB7N76_25450 [Planctomycetota bacterium]